MAIPTTPTTGVNARRSFVLGIGLWAGFSVAAVLLRGVRWDEDYEFAQVITGALQYPEGHPLPRYVCGMFSLQTYLSAALSKLTSSPAVLCGWRNVLFLMATVLPAFLLGTLLTRGRVLAGHVAAAAVLLGMHLPFFSTYPQFVWPIMYSNGHVGTGYALVVLALFLARRMGPAWFLFGLMPCVHLGQWPPLVLFVAFAALQRRPWRPDDVKRATAYGLVGLAGSAAFWCYTRAYVLPAPSIGPYASATDPRQVWLGYMARFASHRSIPWSTGHIALVALPLLALAAARIEAREDGAGGPWRGVALYSLCVALLVWGIMGVHMLLGPNIPPLLIRWIPYRLMNHVPPLLVIASVAVLMRTSPRRPVAALLLAGVLVYGIVKPALRPLVGDALFARYVADSAWALFMLCGSATALLTRDLKEDPRFRTPWLAAALTAWLALAWAHQFGAACTAVGFMSVYLFEQPLNRVLHGSDLRRTLAVLAMALVIVLAYREWTARSHLPVSPFERQVVAYLDARGRPDAMLVADYQQEALQARTGHPVMTDMATITWIAYNPALGPALDKLYADLYGIHFAPTAGDGPPKAWFERWAERPRADWQALGRKYAFSYVIAPNFITLDLPRVVEGETNGLYYVPSRTDPP